MTQLVSMSGATPTPWPKRLWVADDARPGQKRLLTGDAITEAVIIEAGGGGGGCSNFNAPGEDGAARTAGGSDTPTGTGGNTGNGNGANGTAPNSSGGGGGGGQEGGTGSGTAGGNGGTSYVNTGVYGGTLDSTAEGLMTPAAGGARGQNNATPGAGGDGRFRITSAAGVVLLDVTSPLDGGVFSPL